MCTEFTFHRQNSFIFEPTIHVTRSQYVCFFKKKFRPSLFSPHLHPFHFPFLLSSFNNCFIHLLWCIILFSSNIFFCYSFVVPCQSSISQNDEEHALEQKRRKSIIIPVIALFSVWLFFFPYFTSFFVWFGYLPIHSISFAKFHDCHCRIFFSYPKQKLFVLKTDKISNIHVIQYI